MMDKETLVVADHQSWLSSWNGPLKSFEEITPASIAEYRTVVLSPEKMDYLESCKKIIEWKRSGLLGDTRLILGAYKGRHIWSPELDPFVERWVVHARSERKVLDTDKLAFVPLCLMPPRKDFQVGDDGYTFMGGRKWRELGVGIDAMSRSGLPGRVITDLAPEGNFPGVDIRREKVPKPEYMAVMGHARVIIVPLRDTPISHGHVDVITSILVGKPVLVTAGASCDDYVEHGVNGLLVPNNSVEAWTDAILEAHEKADDFAAAAREMAPKYHTPRYAEYIRELVASLN